jgi:hypothetical protein
MKIFAIAFLFVIHNAMAESPVLPSQSKTALDSLAGRVASLERENAEMKRRLSEDDQERKDLLVRVAELESALKKSDSRRLAEILPDDEKEKKSFFENFRKELNSDRDRAKGPWTSADSWSSVRKRMSVFELREVLGTPTRIKQSVKPSVDQVYLYEGDLNADGESESGYVNVKDRRVVSFKSPH